MKSALMLLLPLACACSADAGDPHQATAVAASSLESSDQVPDGAYSVNIYGPGCANGCAIEVRAAAHQLFVVTKDLFGRNTVVIPATSGPYSVVTYDDPVSMTETVSGQVVVQEHTIYLRFRRVMTGHDFPTPHTNLEGEGSYDWATHSSPTGGVHVDTVVLSGTETESAPQHTQRAVQRNATLKAWGSTPIWGTHRTIALADGSFGDVSIDATGAFDGEVMFQSGATSSFRGTTSGGLIKAIYSVSGSVISFDDELTGFYTP
jgi:hypothetical protein